MEGMKSATSRITQQGQIYIPAAVRQRLGLTPGALIEWDLEGDDVVVRRLGRHSSEDIHRAVFAERVVPPVPPVTVDDMDRAIATHLADKHARR